MDLRGKKLLLLGGAHFQVPAIEAANRLGMITICADNRPDNPGHQLAHHSFTEHSTVETSLILDLARRLEVDGVLNYGSDVSAVVCATVCKELGLPGHDPQAIELLTDKGRFRKLLRDEGIQRLPIERVIHPGEDHGWRDLTADVLPLMVKPIDSSGSRGVQRVTALEALGPAIEQARKRSRCGRVVIETWVAKQGFQLCGDGFFQDGKLVYVGYGNGHFHDATGGLVPYAETFPSMWPAAVMDKATAKLERILQVAGFGTGSINLDVIVDQDGEPFVIEIGPRNGGNFIPQVLALWTGVDLTEASVKAAVDPNWRLPQKGREQGFFASYMLHRMHAGQFKKLGLDPQISPHVLRALVYARPGEDFEPFTDGGNAFGNLLLRFDSQDQMMDLMERMDRLFSHD